MIIESPTSVPANITPEKSVGRARLMTLHDYVLEQSQKTDWGKFFYMRDWFQIVPATKINPDWKHGDQVEVNNDCGTAACLLGHAPNVPLFRDLGLEAVFVDWIYPAPRFVPRFGFKFEGQIYSRYETHPFRIIYKLFGISENRASSIFGNGPMNTRNLDNMKPERALADLRLNVDQIDREEGWEF